MPSCGVGGSEYINKQQKPQRLRNAYVRAGGNVRAGSCSAFRDGDYITQLRLACERKNRRILAGASSAIDRSGVGRWIGWARSQSFAREKWLFNPDVVTDQAGPTGASPLIRIAVPVLIWD